MYVCMYVYVSMYVYGAHLHSYERRYLCPTSLSARSGPGSTLLPQRGSAPSSHYSGAQSESKSYDLNWD